MVIDANELAIGFYEASTALLEGSVVLVALIAFLTAQLPLHALRLVVLASLTVFTPLYLPIPLYVGEGGFGGVPGAWPGGSLVWLMKLKRIINVYGLERLEEYGFNSKRYEEALKRFKAGWAMYLAILMLSLILIPLG